MVKAKGKKVRSDQIRKKKSTKKKLSVAESVKSNPFEMKINKRKHIILGQKIMKSERGLPGISKSKSLKKRQDTLLHELKNKRKVNKMKDRRIGENTSMSVEDKMLERFSREQKKHHENSKLFNLDDDNDELTHKGQSIREIETFQDDVSSEDEELAGGLLSGEMVSEGHFGGGVLTQKNPQEEEKSWKDRMEEMIAKSKLAKHERQSEKDDIVKLTDQLDDEWRDIHNLVTVTKRKDAEDDPHINEKATEYDITVNELKFESRGNPTDRLKTDAELAKIERERLDRLEKERLLRMSGQTSDENKQKHQSADDLDDGMDYGSDEDSEKETELVYKDGKLLNNFNERTEDEGGMADELEDNIDGDEYEVSGSEGESSEDDEDEEDMYSDLESGEEEGSDNEDSEGEGEKTTHNKKKLKQEKTPVPEIDTKIPYTFNVPSSYSSFQTLLNKYTSDEQNTVLIRMRKCTHPSLAEENKDLLVRLYGFLLEYFGEISLKSPPDITLINHVINHIRQLTIQYPLQTSIRFKRLLLERDKIFTEYCVRKNGKGIWPFMDTLFYIKLVSMLYPTSDYRHEIVTPTLLHSSNIYCHCATSNHRDVAVGLLLSTIMCEYISFSKVLIPECLNFLNTLLLSTDSTCTANKVVCGTSVCKSKLLSSKSDQQTLRSSEVKAFNLTEVIVRGVGNSIYNSDQFILSAIYTTLSLMLKLTQLYKDLPSASALLDVTVKSVEKLNTEIYPRKIQDLVSELKSVLVNIGPRSLNFVSKERKKPKVLRLYEPSFDEEFDPKARKKTKADPSMVELQKLRQKHKKEMKSTMREIRRDKEFISSQTIQDKLSRDAERKKKTKQILSDLQTQQHDINMFNKTKKKK